MNTSIFLVLILFGLTLIAIGWIYGDSTSPNAYHNADRRVKWLHIAFGSFTVLGAQELIGFTSIASGLGFYAISLPLGFAVGAIILGLIGEKARSISAQEDLLASPDYLAVVYDRRVSLLGTIINCLALGAVLLIQIVFGAQAISALVGLPLFGSIVFITLILIIYVLIGGYKAIMATDVLQGIAMLFLVAVLAFFLFYEAPNNTPSITNFQFNDIFNLPELTTSTFLTVVVYFISGLTAILGGADLWQRMLSADSTHSFKKGIFGTAILYIVFGFGIIAVSIAILHYYPDLKPDNAFTEFLTISAPKYILALSAIGVFAAIISTADTELLVISLMISKELNRYGLNKKIEVKDTMISLSIVAAVSATIGYFLADQLANLYFSLLNMLLITGPLMLLALFNLGTKRLVFAATAISLLVFVVLVLSGYIAIGAWSLLLLAPFIPCFFVKNNSTI